MQCLVSLGEMLKNILIDVDFLQEHLETLDQSTRINTEVSPTTSKTPRMTDCSGGSC